MKLYLLFYSDGGNLDNNLAGVFTSIQALETARNEHNKYCGEGEYDDEEDGEWYSIQEIEVDKYLWLKN